MSFITGPRQVRSTAACSLSSSPAPALHSSPHTALVGPLASFRPPGPSPALRLSFSLLSKAHVTHRCRHVRSLWPVLWWRSREIATAVAILQRRPCIFIQYHPHLSLTRYLEKHDTFHVTCYWGKPQSWPLLCHLLPGQQLRRVCSRHRPRT